MHRYLKVCHICLTIGNDLNTIIWWGEILKLEPLVCLISVTSILVSRLVSAPPPPSRFVAQATNLSHQRKVQPIS